MKAHALQPLVGPNLIIPRRVLYALRGLVDPCVTLENGMSNGMLSASLASRNVDRASSAASFTGSFAGPSSTYSSSAGAEMLVS